MHTYRKRTFPLSVFNKLGSADPLDVFAIDGITEDESALRWKLRFADRAKLEDYVGAPFPYWYRIILRDLTPAEARQILLNVESVIDDDGLLAAAEEWPLVIILDSAGYEYVQIPWLFMAACRMKLPEVPMLVAQRGTIGSDPMRDHFRN